MYLRQKLLKMVERSDKIRGQLSRYRDLNADETDKKIRFTQIFIHQSLIIIKYLRHPRSKF